MNSRDLTIINGDYQDVIDAYDTTRTVFYFDPPWIDNICQDRYGGCHISYSDIVQWMKRLKGFVLMTCNPASLAGLDMSNLFWAKVNQKYGSCNFVKCSGGRRVLASKIVMVSNRELGTF